ncbi:MAG TPA: c-type cytochrome [Verrucomicrobiae bacterium]|nr:c-type cytochrome [Verrucomicrobiae bacterium]
MKNFIIGVIFALVVAAAGVSYYVMKGYVNTRADQPPSAIESKLAMSAMDASADRNAPDQKNPVTATEENLVAGAKLFHDNCAGCHGLPSNSDTEFGESFYPPVPQFFKDAPDMPDNENFYVIKHGVRWTGMPAWNKTLTDQQIWQITTFLATIGKLPPAALQQLEPPLQPAAAATAAPAKAEHK